MKNIDNNFFTYKDTLNLTEAYSIINSKTIFDITYDEIKTACSIILNEIAKIKAINENDDDLLFGLKENFETVYENCYKNNEVFDLAEDAIIMLSRHLTELHTWAEMPVHNIIIKTLKRCKVVTTEKLEESKKVYFIKLKNKRGTR